MISFLGMFIITIIILSHFKHTSNFNCNFIIPVLGVSSIFYVVAFISFVQLLICCWAEYQRLKQPSFLRACRVTTQKVLYFVVFLASLMRAAYFTKPEILQPAWAYYLMSAYYPLLMTCASLIICFWAEIFHLRDIRWERQFISKSFLGFLAFNLLPYSLFGAEASITLLSDIHGKLKLSKYFPFRFYQPNSSMIVTLFTAFSMLAMPFFYLLLSSFFLSMA